MFPHQTTSNVWSIKQFIFHPPLLVRGPPHAGRSGGAHCLGEGCCKQKSQFFVFETYFIDRSLERRLFGFVSLQTFFVVLILARRHMEMCVHVLGFTMMGLVRREEADDVQCASHTLRN